MEAVFSGGVPLKITPYDFRRRHLQSFPKVASEQYDELLTLAIDDVYTMFAGVATLFDRSDKQTWFDKTRLCYLALTAWYIADAYPLLVSGVPFRGDILLKRKKIGGVDISYVDMSLKDISTDNLSFLLSNPFGKSAYMMIKTSPKRMLLRNAHFQ
jgi:hypothetical protein